MIVRPIQKGSTNVSTVIRIIDSGDQTPETGVASVTSGLALEYRREGELSVGLTEDDLGALTDAHADGKMLHIGNGYYRVDIPDAAFATGSSGVLIHGTVTGMIVIGAYHPLTGHDAEDLLNSVNTASNDDTKLGGQIRRTHALAGGTKSSKDHGAANPTIVHRNEADAADLITETRTVVADVETLTPS